MKTSIRVSVFALMLASLAVAQIYIVKTVAGGALQPTPVAARSAAVAPAAVAVDASGNIYFTSHQAVFKADLGGNLTRVAGAPGGANSLGDGGQATSAYLNDPQGLAIDASGNLYIADAKNNRIRKVTPAGIISTVAGNGTPGYTGDGAAATSAELDSPNAVTVDSAGNLFIADTSNMVIRKVTPAGIISTYAGNGSGGYSGDGGQATSAALHFPFGVSVDYLDNVYIADTVNKRIRKVTPAGTISTIAGGGNATPADGLPATTVVLSYPTGVVMGDRGDLYFNDYSDCRVYVVRADGTIATLAGTGIYGYSGDGIAAAGSELAAPSAVAVDSSDNVYIADLGNFRVREVEGEDIWTVAGNGSVYYGNGGAATSAQFGSAMAGAVDVSGNLYIADETGNRVLKVTPGGTISILAGNGIAGFSGDGASAVSAELNQPVGVAVDASGNVYINDYSNSRIRKVAPGGIISTVAGNGQFGCSGDGGPATSAAISGYGLAVGPAGNVFLADSWCHRIRKIVPGGNITTVAGNGTPGFSGDGGAATSAQLWAPAGVAVGSAGNIYVADTDNNRVRVVSVAGIISTVAGTGACAYTGDGGAATAATLCLPESVAIASSTGDLYISDTYNLAVRRVESGTINTVAGTGLPGYSGDGGFATLGQISPQGLAVDSNGVVYVADTSNAVVRSLTKMLIIKLGVGSSIQ